MGVFTVGRQVALEIDMPGWWLANASVDMDFRRGLYYDSSTANRRAATDFLSCTRALIGYAKTAEGTLSQFASNALRITLAGLLVEDARTNYIYRSQELDDATNWPVVNVTVTADQTTAPDGTVTADKLLTSNTTDPTVRSGHNVTTVASTIYTFSCYLKAGSGGTWVRLELGSNDGGNVTRQWFNLSGAGSLGTHSNGASATVFWDSASIEALANGWYCCAISGHGTSTNIIFYDPICGPFSADNSTTGSGVNDFIYAWGAQFEIGAFPSSYIPTTGAAATRAADAVNIAGNLATVLFGTSASIVLDQITAFDNNGYLVGESDGGSNLMQASTGAGGKALAARGYAAYIWPGSETFLTGIKVGQAWTTGSGSISGDGYSVNTSVTPWSSWVANANHVYLGSYGGGSWIYAYFRRLTVWNSKLADATLQALTAP